MMEYLEQLENIEGIRCAFIERVEGIEVSTDRHTVVKSLEPVHQQAVQNVGGQWDGFWRAEQVHGNDIAIVDADLMKKYPHAGSNTIPKVDGLITNQLGEFLGIYVADCGAIYIVDKKTKAIGILHSGKKGTEQNIIGKAIGLMQEHYGSDPSDLLVSLAPCIRPCHYEVDFPSQIREQVIAAGVLSSHYVDCGECTAAGIDRYYSYRLEKGNTGRMLAVLGRIPV